MATIDKVFTKILAEANESGLEAIEPFKKQEVWANAWGSLYISKEGDFGKWLKKQGFEATKKGFEISIPHYFYDAMRAYSHAYKKYMEKYGIVVYDDIAYN